MLNMFSGEHESDASSTTSEVPELPHTPRGINDRPLLQLYTTVSSRSDHPTSQVSMATSLPSPITPTAQGSSSVGYGRTPPVQAYPYDPYHSNLPYPVIFYPPPTLLPPRFQVSEDEYEFLRGRSGSAEDSLLAGLSGPISNYDLGDRLLVVLRCLRRLQFGSLGDFLADLFGSRHKDHDKSSLARTPFASMSARRPVSLDFRWTCLRRHFCLAARLRAQLCAQTLIVDAVEVNVERVCHMRA